MNNNNLFIFLKGLLMGVCDLIPGISGGTVAFITGIYERLINAVSLITPINYLKLVFSKNNKTRKSHAKKLDLGFLFFLFFGIFTAIILGSNVISYLIDNFYVYVFSFFSGLIFASSIFILKQIKLKNNINKFFGVLGILFGIILLFFSPSEVSSPSNLLILLSGFLAIFALFLPGISGSFILVILGTYEIVVNYVKDFNFEKIGIFGIGALAGVFIISRLVKFLFKKDKDKTLFFLSGLVIGTLFIPIRNIYLEIVSSSGFSFGLVFNLIILFVFGFWIVKKMEHL